MIRTAATRVVTGVAWFAAFVLLSLSPAIGSISSILAVLLVLLLSPTLLLRNSWTGFSQQLAMQIFVAAFAALTICFAITQRNPGDVLFAANFLALLLAPIVYLLATRGAGDATIKAVALLCVAGAFIGAGMAFYDVFVMHRERALGIASGGNLMARSVVPLGFIGMAGLFVTSGPVRWLFPVGLLASLLALYLTGTRGVFVAVPVLGLILIWALLRQYRASRRWYALGLGVLAVALVAVATLSSRFQAMIGMIPRVLTEGVGALDFGAQDRLYMLNAGWWTFLKSPWIGFGWANFTEAAKPEFGIYFFHNDFFDVAVAAGVIGIACWIGVLAAPLVGLRAIAADRFSTLRLYCALILSVSFFLFGLTDMTFGYDLPTTLYAFLTAIVLGAFREARPAAAAA